MVSKDYLQMAEMLASMGIGQNVDIFTWSAFWLFIERIVIRFHPFAFLNCPSQLDRDLFARFADRSN